MDVQAGNDDLHAGDYILTTDGGRTLDVVSPARREVTRWSPDALGRALGAELRRGGRIEGAAVTREGPRSGGSRRRPTVVG